MVEEKLTIEKVREEARQKLMGICGVYKNCDGDPMRICQGQSYGRSLGIGGIGSGASFNNNYLALKKYPLNMRVIGEDFEPDTTYDFFGNKLSMPIMGASVAGVNSFGGEEVISESEFCRAIVQGCKEAGTLGWRGDTYTYSLQNTYGIDSIAEVEGWGVKIIKPREQEVILKFIAKAEKAGCLAVGVDVDGCGSYAMATHQQPVYKKTEEELKELVTATKLPFIVKGIMSIEDAIIAQNAGAAAIVVSNHGGRVLDHTPGTADVLHDIRKHVKKEMKVLVDGGIRTGYDVLKMLALGAEAVLIGRDLIRASVGAGIEGVKIHMGYLRKTLEKAMKMTYCYNVGEVLEEVIFESLP